MAHLDILGGQQLEKNLLKTGRFSFENGLKILSKIEQFHQSTNGWGGFTVFSSCV